MSRRISRRRFIQSTAAAAAAFTIIKPGSARGYAANDTVSVACIGAGGQGGVNRNDLKAAGFKIVALCEVDKGRLDKAQKEHPDARAWSDFRKMLEQQKDIDAVMVSTADHTHYPAAMMAMKLGKHASVEKPMVHSVWEARQLGVTARQQKVMTQLDNEGHSSEGIRVVVEMLRTGAIGNIQEAHIWTDRPIWPQGLAQRPPTEPVPAGLDWDLWIGPAPFRDYHKHLHPFSWRGWWDFGTGALGDMGCHFWDSALWALDLVPPTTVEAEHQGNSNETGPNWSIVTSRFPERPVNMKYEDPRKGAPLTAPKWPAITLKWYDGKKQPPRPEELEPDRKMPTNGSLFIGDQGKLLVNDVGSPRLIPETKMKEYHKPPAYLPRVPGGHKADWLRAIKTGQPAGSDFALYGGPLTEIVLLGNVAIRTGMKLEWDSANLKATNAPEASQYVKREYRKGWEF